MSEAAIVALLGLAALVLFTLERLPAEVVALGLAGALALFGVLTPGEALSGFSHPAVVTYGGLLVLSEALARTGVVSIVARHLFKISTPRRIAAAILAVVPAVSAWMSNTALVALLIPILAEVSVEKGVPRSRLYLPLSYATILGGAATTIGTSSHILGASLYETLTGKTIFLFAPLPFALLFFFAASLYLLTFGHRTLPDREPDVPPETHFAVDDFLTQVRVLPESPLVGRAVRDGYLRETHDLRIVAVARGKERHFKIPPDLRLASGDVLLVQGEPEALAPIADLLRVEIEPELTLEKEAYAKGRIEYVEVIVGPNARQVNQPIAHLRWVEEYGATVLAVLRRGRLRKRRLDDMLLTFGDLLILQGPAGLAERFEKSREFLLRRELRLPVERRSRIPLAVGALAVVLMLGATGRLPYPIAALLGATFVVVTGCVTPREMHRALPWQVILLVAGLIPFSIAFERSGLADRVASLFIAASGAFGERGALLLVVVTASLLAQFVEPSAVVMLMLPLAVTTAGRLGAPVVPFVLGVMFAAAYAFATPFSNAPNILVKPLAGYRTADFARQGIPLLVLFWLLAAAFLPMLYG